MEDVRQVYIKRYKKQNLWNGSDWTSAIELAKTYTPDEARAIIQKRWGKGLREYKKSGATQILCYTQAPHVYNKPKRWHAS